jgi:hypothetical protein
MPVRRRSVHGAGRVPVRDELSLLALPRRRRLGVQADGVAPIFEDEVSAAFRFENLILNLLETEAARSFTDPDGHIWEVAQSLSEA